MPFTRGHRAQRQEHPRGASPAATSRSSLAKRAFGYTRSTGDCYLLAIPVATVIGRIGCFLSELPLGTPTDLPWGISVSPAAAAAFARCPGCDVPMHPSMLYEIALQPRRDRRHPPATATGSSSLATPSSSTCWRRGSSAFLVEFVRGNELQALGPDRAAMGAHPDGRPARRCISSGRSGATPTACPPPPSPIARPHGGTVMTDAGTPDAEDPLRAARSPARSRLAGPWQTGSRVEQLAVWMQALRSSYTDAALERSAIAGRLHARGVRRRPGCSPTRASRRAARRSVRSARAASWIVLARLRRSSGSSSRSRTCSDRARTAPARSPRGS